MIKVEVSSNSAEVAEWFRRLYSDQVPFATALAVNETAKDFQAEQRAGVRGRFTIRRPWVLRGAAKINRDEFATKTKPEAIVRVDPERNFLVKFETGGVRLPRGSHLAVPDEARRTKAGVVSRTMRPRSLGFERSGRGRYATVFRGAKRTFMVRRHGRSPGGGIFQRVGRGKYSRVRVLFTFTPEARIDAALRFEKTAAHVVHARFEENFVTAFNRSVDTAR